MGSRSGICFSISLMINYKPFSIFLHLLHHILQEQQSSQTCSVFHPAKLLLPPFAYPATIVLVVPSSQVLMTVFFTLCFITTILLHHFHQYPHLYRQDTLPSFSGYTCLSLLETYNIFHPHHLQAHPQQSFPVL